MTNIEQTIAEIRHRDSMYPTNELTAGAVADRRTLLHIIDQMQRTELEQFKAMLQDSAHRFSETPLDEEEAPGYVTVQVVPDVHKQMLLRFTFDDEGDFTSLYPDWPASWKVTVE